jgi:hypothetical protein
MGCDIHVMLEHRKRGDERWDAMSYYPINPGRNYQKFSRLAGVRGDGEGYPYIEPRGMPHDASWATCNEYWLFIHEEPGNGERYVNPKDAESWVLQNISQYRKDGEGKNCWVSDPDQHSHTWLTFNEWLAAVTIERSETEMEWDIDWGALTAAARWYEDNGHETRFCFWFDN